MTTRRQLLYGGLGALVLGHPASRLAASILRSDGPSDSGPLSSYLDFARPFRAVSGSERSFSIDGVEFAHGFTGDPYPNPHYFMPGIPGGSPHLGVKPPPPTESADVVVVGGGISGLAAGYMLRERNPIIIEYHDRFGGNAQGESWKQNKYSLGGAYVITPDPGSFLEAFYLELGLDRVVRVDEGAMEVELNGTLPRGFWDGTGLSPEDMQAFAAYADVVAYMANDGYPCIPPSSPADARWVNELDQKTLKQDIEEQMGMPAPTLLASAIQSYCYSSFAAGWEEVSAASGWNFLAAEEYGRWVLPGGNAYMADAMYQAIADAAPEHAFPLRGSSAVTRIVPTDNGVEVTYLNRIGGAKTILAQQVVVACPKHVVKHIIPDLETLDAEKCEAINELQTRAYVVANVLLDANVDLDFYDIFLLEDGSLPTNMDEAQKDSRVIDVLHANFAGPDGKKIDSSVLTLYWPLPFTGADGRNTMVQGDGSVGSYASLLREQLPGMLDLLGVGTQHVRQVRLTFFGHAMPLSAPNFIASGAAERVRRPIQDRIWFVNQDNWALPAVENCLLDAEEFVPQILDQLG